MSAKGADESADVPGTTDETQVLPDAGGKYVVFFLEGQRYALPLSRVQEIQQIVEPTPVPDPSPAMVGMISLRGDVVPVVDLRAKLGMGGVPYGLQTPMVVSRAGERLVALVVDEMDDVLELAPEAVRAPSDIGGIAGLLTGVGHLPDGLVFLLDLDVIVTQEEAAEAVAGTGAVDDGDD